jgi:hypothetical protein
MRHWRSSYVSVKKFSDGKIPLNAALKDLWGKAMETWNREELYAEVWEQPLVKIAPKYSMSAAAVGKVYQKLRIPLPGRGYWVTKTGA